MRRNGFITFGAVALTACLCGSFLREKTKNSHAKTNPGPHRPATATSPPPLQTVSTRTRRTAKPDLLPSKRPVSTTLPPATPATPNAPLVDQSAWYDREGGPFEFDELVSHWDSEPRDEEWTSNVESYFTAMLEPDEVDRGVLKSVDCRQSLCRVQLRTNDNTAIWRLEDTLRKQDHFPYERRMIKDKDETLVDGIMARDGIEDKVFRRFK